MEGTSHTDPAHAAAQERYSAAMEAEDKRYTELRERLDAEHATNVDVISAEYTDALGKGGESA